MAAKAGTAEPHERRVRPRNRKAHIIDAAILLFHRDGYHRVGMEDIAAAVGITAGALYRHFGSKQDLLGEALCTVIDEYTAVAAAAEDLDTMLAALARHAVEHRDRGPLWQRHGRDLTPDRQKSVWRRLRTLAGKISGPLRDRRPELSAAEADMLSWATLAVLGSPFEHGVTLTRPRLDQVVHGCAQALLTTTRFPAPAAKPLRAKSIRAAGGLMPASRREALLVTAGRLFREHGYDAVTIEAIGAAAGIAGPSIYNHFGSKLEMLLALLERGRETLQAGLTLALASAQTPEQALEPVVRSYVVPASLPDGLPGLLWSEYQRLPEQRRRPAQRLQRDYLDEWVRLLPHGLAEGRVIVHAAIAVVNSVVEIAHLRSRPHFAEEAVGLTLDVLRSGGVTHR